MIELSEQEKNKMYDSLRDYINDVCIIRRPTGNKDFVLQSTVPNEHYEWQFYLRRGLFNAMFLRYVSMLFWDRYAERWKKQPFQIAGLETGSTPLIVGLALHSHLFDINVNAFSVREKRKTYGMLNRMEGIPNDLPVMLVDDLCNSKNTMHKAKQHCEEDGLKIYDTAFVVVNKNILATDTKNTDKHIGDSLKVDSLFYADDFALTYEDYIKEQNMQEFTLT